MQYNFVRYVGLLGKIILTNMVYGYTKYGDNIMSFDTLADVLC